MKLVAASLSPANFSNRRAPTCDADVGVVALRATLPRRSAPPASNGSQTTPASIDRP